MLKNNLLIILVVAGFFITYSFIAVTGHRHFETFGWDLGFFDQIIWKASKGDLVAYSTLARENLLADHFQPALYLIAPLYRLISDVKILLITQAFLVVTAGLPIFLIAKKISKNGIFSFSVMISYQLFLGTQWLTLNEFHQMAFLPLFLSVLFLSLQEKNKMLYWISFIGILTVKEENGLLLSAIGLIVWWKYHWKLVGISTIILGILSFFFLVNYLMPKLSVSGIYSHLDFGEAGYTPEDVLLKSAVDPVFFIKSMVCPQIKLQTVFNSFLSFGFLPLLTPVMLFPIGENFITRFIYAGPQFTKWMNVNQHAAPLGVLLALSSIYSGLFIVKYLKRRWSISEKKVWILLSIYLLTATIFQDIRLHGPVNSVFKKQLYETQVWMENNEQVINKIPVGVSVSAQNSMLPHVSQRKEIYLLPEINNAEYIIVDLKEGPNKFSPLNLETTESLIKKVLSENQYKVYFQKGDALLLQKI